MDKELAQLRTLLGDARTESRHGMEFILGSVAGKEVVLQKCGIGKVNSAVGPIKKPVLLLELNTSLDMETLETFSPPFTPN